MTKEEFDKIPTIKEYFISRGYSEEFAEFADEEIPKMWAECVADGIEKGLKPMSVGIKNIEFLEYIKIKEK